MSIFDYLVLLGTIHFIFTSIVQWIILVPISLVYFGLLKHDSKEKILFPIMLNMFLLTAAMGSITINVCYSIESPLRVLIFKFIGGFVVYMHLIKEYWERKDEYEKTKNIRRIWIFHSTFLLYILIMIFPNLVDIRPVWMLMDLISWIYSIPYVGFIFKIGGFLIALVVIFFGIKTTFIWSILILNKFFRKTGE